MAHLATADTLTAPTPRATILGGRYSLDQVIGEGGMAVVYRARHLELDQTVAIKLVLPELAFDQEATARFLNEARTIAKLRSPHVARVLDSGLAEPGRPFMVLEYLEGGDLRKLLDVNSTVPVETAVGMVLEAAEALAEAHASGIVHRDIKPENLFLARMADGTVTLKVLDFGICKHQTSDRSRSFTLRGRTLGSPHYMAPEQITSPEMVDERVDIWALGVVLYELLSGYQPFVGETLTNLCSQVVHSPPRKALRKVNPEIPVALERIVLRCLKKKPSERYASVVELAGALSPFCSRGSQLMERIRCMAGHEKLALRSVTPLALNMDARHFRPGRRWVGPTLSAFAVAAGLLLLASRNGDALSAFHSVTGRFNGAAAGSSVAAAKAAPQAVATMVSPLRPEPTVQAVEQAHVSVAAAEPVEIERAEWSPSQAARAPARVARSAQRPAAEARSRSYERPPVRPAERAIPQRGELMAPSSVSTSDRDTSELIAPYGGGT